MQSLDWGRCTKDNTENYENENIEVENYEVIVTPSEEILAGYRDATSETYQDNDHVIISMLFFKVYKADLYECQKY